MTKRTTGFIGKLNGKQNDEFNARCEPGFDSNNRFYNFVALFVSALLASAELVSFQY